MADSDKPEFNPTLVLEQGTLHTFSPVRGRAGIGGEEVEEPMISLSFRWGHGIAPVPGS